MGHLSEKPATAIWGFGYAKPPEEIGEKTAPNSSGASVARDPLDPELDSESGERVDHHCRGGSVGQGFKQTQRIGNLLAIRSPVGHTCTRRIRMDADPVDQAVRLFFAGNDSATTSPKAVVRLRRPARRP